MESLRGILSLIYKDIPILPVFLTQLTKIIALISVNKFQ